jgi:hypothetical protein
MWSAALNPRWVARDPGADVVFVVVPTDSKADYPFAFRAPAIAFEDSSPLILTPPDPRPDFYPPPLFEPEPPAPVFAEGAAPVWPAPWPTATTVDLIWPMNRPECSQLTVDMLHMLDSIQKQRRAPASPRILHVHALLASDVDRAALTRALAGIARCFCLCKCFSFVWRLSDRLTLRSFCCRLVLLLCCE